MTSQELFVNKVSRVWLKIRRKPVNAFFFLAGLFLCLFSIVFHFQFLTNGLLILSGLLGSVAVLVIGFVLFIFNLASISIVLIESRDKSKEEPKSEMEDSLEREWLQRALIRYLVGTCVWIIICVGSTILLSQNVGLLTGVYLSSLAGMFWLVPEYENPFLNIEN